MLICRALPAISGSHSLGRLDDLGQHAPRRPRVHERDARAADADPGVLVDQRDPRLPQRRKRRVDIGHLVGHVVQPGPSLGEELPHRRVLAERRQQLHVVLADIEQHRLDALLLRPPRGGPPPSESVSPQPERGVDLLDGHADVVDALEHARQSIDRPYPRSRSRPPPSPRRPAAQPDARRALQAGHALHDPLDRLALEHLVLEQLLRERVELAAVADDHPLRRAARFLDQVLALLVADPQRRLGQPHVAVGRAAKAGGAHRVVVHHRVRDARPRA